MFGLRMLRGSLAWATADYVHRLLLFVVVCTSVVLNLGMVRAMPDPMFDEAKVLSFHLGTTDSDLPNLELKKIRDQIAGKIGSLLAKSLQDENKRSLIVVTSPEGVRQIDGNIDEASIVRLSVDVLVRHSSDTRYVVVATFKLGRSIGGEPLPGARNSCNCQARVWTKLAFEQAIGIDTADEFALFLYKEFFPTFEQQLKK
jgi:hypothetical protein